MALILGIETSCDETAAAVVEDGRKILSNVVASQVALHAQYGGVFPEIASREHVLKIIPVIQDALRQASATLDDLDHLDPEAGATLLEIAPDPDQTAAFWRDWDAISAWAAGIAAAVKEQN